MFPQLTSGRRNRPIVHLEWSFEMERRPKKDPDAGAVTAGAALPGEAQKVSAVPQQLASVLERISDGFVVLDGGWRFTYLNRKGEELFRRVQKSRGSLVGKVLWEEFPEIVGTEIERNYRRATEDQVTVEFETYLPVLDAWYVIRAY